MLHHVPSPALQDRVFSEARRVLRPGGVFVATDSLDSADLRPDLPPGGDDAAMTLARARAYSAAIEALHK